ncbi:unnamed protein product [Parajaminaea phylloscopi]
MPAAGISKLALHLSRFANFQAVHQGANAFRGTAGSGASGSASSAASLSSAGAGAGPGSGAGGAKFHAGRGAHFTYTNTGGRAVVQAGSSSSSDGPNGLDDDEEAHLQQSSRHGNNRPHHPYHSARYDSRLPPHSPSGRSPNGVARSSTVGGTTRDGCDPAKDPALAAHPLTDNVMQARFRHAFAALAPPATVAEGTEDTASERFNLASDTAHGAPSTGALPTAELYRDLIDAKKRRDRVAIVSLVDAYRRLPPSEKTTAGFNVALQAQLSVREPGESLREVRQTHRNMLEAGCVPNSSTSAVLVKALCLRDHEKQTDDSVPAVSAEEEASSEAWRLLQTSGSGLQDISAYNALLSRCAAKGETHRARAVFARIVDGAKVAPDAATYAALIDCYAAAGGTDALAEISNVLQLAREAMQAVHWDNDSDVAIFEAYVRAMNALKLPQEAVAIFEEMVLDDELPAPSAGVTEVLIRGFLDSGDIDTARAWVEKIETLNASCVDGKSVVAAPDFTQIKQSLESASLPLSQETSSPPDGSAAKRHEGRIESPPDSAASPPMSRPSSGPLRAPEDISTDFVPPAVPTHLTFQPSAPTGYPPLQCIDCDLGERIKAMLRARKQGTQHQPNLEGAFRLVEREIFESGNYAPPEVFAQLLNLYGRAGKLARVHQLRDYAHVAVAGLVGDLSWQSAAWIEVEDNVVSALAHGGDVSGAHAVRHSMLAVGVPLSANAYAALISSIRDSTDEALIAEQLWEESQRLGVRPNIYLVNTVISRLGRARRAEQALNLYNSLPALGLKPTSITYGASLNCAVRVGDIHTAEAIFAEMESDPSFVPRPPAYNSMIQFFTYTKPDRAKALEYWEKMQAKSVEPSSHTYKLLLDVQGAIEPVDVSAMNAVFLRLLRDHSVQVAGPHWAALISCHGQDLAKCQDIFRSIPLKTGSAPDAVAYEALLQVYANHARVDLIDGLLAEMMRLGVNRTAYIANHAIEGYAKDGSPEGLTKARTIFLAMSQPPAGVASTGNHPLPRHHGIGSGVANAMDAASAGPRVARSRPCIEDVLADVAAPPVGVGSAAEADFTVTRDLESTLPLLQAAFAQVHPEPSTYEKMVSVELEAGCHWNAQCVVERMSERAFPSALVVKARTLLAKGPRVVV